MVQMPAVAPMVVVVVVGSTNEAYSLDLGGEAGLILWVVMVRGQGNGRRLQGYSMRVIISERNVEVVDAMNMEGKNEASVQ